MSKENENRGLTFINPSEEFLYASGGDGQRSYKPLGKSISSGDVSNLNNFVGDTNTVWKLLALVGGHLCKKPADMDPAGIKIKHFYLHQVEIENKDGEIVPCVRTALVTVDGKAFGFVADSITKELDTIISLFGFGPWEDGIHVKVVSSDTRSGGRIYSLVPAV